ncbi:MAG: sigma-54-dependent transcriptional regulator [Nannocystaceae bacterium]
MLQPTSRILLVDDEPNLRKVLGALLRQQGHEVHAEVDGSAALLRVQSVPSQTFDAVITDLRMPNLDGIGLIKALSQHEPNLPIIVLTAHGSVDSAVEAVKLGAFDYLEKPFDRDQIHQVVAKALATRQRSGQSPGAVVSPPESSDDPCRRAGMVGRSQATNQVREIVRTVAASPSTVLLTGESGTGKELLARALHLGSSRSEQPFIRVNCAAIPSGLLESELFGHEGGTGGTISPRAGRFELADGGTLFLDEVSEIPKESQVKLLRAIQDSEFERVGGAKTIRVNVRLIAATNRNLEADIRAGSFREDLYYRLNVVPIDLPALRERVEDLPLLVSHFIQRCNERLGKAITGITPEALKALELYAWPGNIRELENLIERMVLFASGPQIEASDLPEAFDAGAANADTEPRDATQAGDSGLPSHIRLPLSSFRHDLKEAVKAGSRLVEEALIREALLRTDGNVTRSARALGISRRSLQSKMKELGLREMTTDDPTRPT